MSKLKLHPIIVKFRDIKKSIAWLDFILAVLFSFVTMASDFADHNQAIQSSKNQF